MSTFLFPERPSSSADLQSWGSQLKPDFRGSFHSVTGKENQPVSIANRTYSYASSSARVTPFKPVNRDILSVDKPRIKVGGFVESLDQEIAVSKLNDEIEEIECEISMLRSRLEDLRLQKIIVSLKKPNEIAGSAKSNRLGGRGIASPVLSRRKSCFIKLESTDHENAVKSLSVPSRRLKKEDGVISSVQPKKLFEKSVPVGEKKAMRPARAVASRYNKNANQLLSLEESGDRSSGVKKRSEEEEECVVAVPYLLPRIKTVRFVDESPRDSGPAKRVADLVGKKSFFAADDEEAEGPVYQTFRFDE